METEKFLKEAYPDIINPKAGMALITEWEVENRSDQRRVAEASLQNMELSSPPEGLLSYYTYLGTDGHSILHYSHWRDEQDHLRFVEQGLPQRLEELFKQVEIRSRQLLGKYRLYRTVTGDSGSTPGCVVIIQEEFESPEITPEWIDTVIAALESEEQPPMGGLSAYFHISLDGKSMLNYAEWTSEQAHQDAMDRSENGTIGLSPLWEKVVTFPGRKNLNSIKRYKFYRAMKPTA